MSDDELDTLCYDEILHETDLAWCLLIDKEQFWIPKSLVDEHDERLKEMDVPVWLLEERGLV